MNSSSSSSSSNSNSSSSNNSSSSSGSSSSSSNSSSSSSSSDSFNNSVLAKYITKYMIKIYDTNKTIKSFQKILIYISKWSSDRKIKEYNKFQKWNKENKIIDYKTFYKYILYISKFLYENPSYITKSPDKIYNKFLYFIELLNESLVNYQKQEVNYYNFNNNSAKNVEKYNLPSQITDNVLKYISPNDFYYETQPENLYNDKTDDIKEITIYNKTHNII